MTIQYTLIHLINEMTSNLDASKSHMEYELYLVPNSAIPPRILKLFQDDNVLTLDASLIGYNRFNRLDPEEAIAEMDEEQRETYRFYQNLDEWVWKLPNGGGDLDEHITIKRIWRFTVLESY